MLASLLAAVCTMGLLDAPVRDASGVTSGKVRQECVTKVFYQVYVELDRPLVDDEVIVLFYGKQLVTITADSGPTIWIRSGWGEHSEDIDVTFSGVTRTDVGVGFRIVSVV